MLGGVGGYLGAFCGRVVAEIMSKAFLRKKNYERKIPYHKPKTDLSMGLKSSAIIVVNTCLSSVL